MQLWNIYNKVVPNSTVISLHNDNRIGVRAVLPSVDYN